MFSYMPKDINYAANERGRAQPSIICFKLDFSKWDRFWLPGTDNSTSCATRLMKEVERRTHDKIKQNISINLTNLHLT